jgi:DNA ligase (NAD+)
LFKTERIVMKRNDAGERIDRLRKEILRHNILYYTQGKPEISDSEYDSMLAELRALEAEYPEHARVDSPTRTVGAPVAARSSKVRHSAPMLSLESAVDAENVRRFAQNCSSATGAQVKYMCEPKLDGVSVELVYENGRFSRAATRGDGLTGEDITANVLTVDTVPLRLAMDDPPALLAVRGEIMMHISDFQALNRKMAEKGENTFANPRNVVSGSIRQLDAGITASRPLKVYCYRILVVEGAGPATQKASLEYLRAAGLAIPPGTKYCSDVEEAIEYHHVLESGRDRLDYEIDGMVLKVDDIYLQEKLGERTNNPRWALAYKFKPRQEKTRVDDIVVQVGRTGILTPLALLHPVEVGGVTVSRATLHNMDQVRRLGVRIGDTVRVERAGDVIPYVSEVVPEKRTGREKEFHMPSECPSCGTKLQKEDVFYRCPAGLACPAQRKEAIIHFAARGAMDIEGLSEKTVQMLLEKGLIDNIPDIYKLDREDLMALEGWKEKRSENLLRAIEASRNRGLDNFIYALGIRNVGKHISRVLMQRYHTLEALKQADIENLMEIEEIGPEIARNITDFFSDKRNLRIIEELMRSGVRIKRVRSVGRGPFSGIKAVFTGSLDLPRSEARKKFQEAGGTVASSVGKSVDVLICGKNPGSKLEKARSLGLKILSEKEFNDIMEGRSSFG